MVPSVPLDRRQPRGAALGTAPDGQDGSWGLYPGLLREDWWKLHPVVQRMHAGRGAGVFEIRRGAGRLARLLLWMMRMPEAADAVPIRLEIVPCEEGERWVRWFGDHMVVSTQNERTGSLLGERFGRLELSFRLQVAGGALHYERTGASLCLGHWRLKLPVWLAPRVVATEAPAGRDRTHVLVRVSAPAAGFLISYEGRMQRLDAQVR